MSADVSDNATFFQFSRSPFSLTPDPAFYFRSRSHGRVFDAVSLAITRRESLMLVVGDLGVGKTTLCRTLMESRDRRWRAAFVGNALVAPADLLRLMLQDLGAIPDGDSGRAQLAGAGLTDRKSTRLNSSHSQISYAVFCLKKKNKK